MSRYERNSNLLVAAIGIVGVIVVAAYVGYLGARSQILIPIQATQTAEAKDVTTQLSLVEKQLAQIDESLRQSLSASIAYNAPTEMNLDESKTIELLLNPTIS